MATRTSNRKTTPKGKKLKSRAVLRDVEPGSTVECAQCGERVKFQAKMRHKQVICNVYRKGVWVRVEHFHEACYDEAGQPYGALVDAHYYSPAWQADLRTMVHILDDGEALDFVTARTEFYLHPTALPEVTRGLRPR